MRSLITKIKNGLKAHIRLLSVVYLFVIVILFGCIAAAIMFLFSDHKDRDNGFKQNISVEESDKIQKTLDIMNERDKEFSSSKRENFKDPF